MFKPMLAEDVEKLSEVLFRMQQKINPAEWAGVSTPPPLESGVDLPDEEIFDLLNNDLEEALKIIGKYYHADPKPI